MRRPPTISFLIPTVNETRPLSRAIDSIRHQLAGQYLWARWWPPLHWLLRKINGTDEILIVIDTHSGPRLRINAVCEGFRKQGYNLKILEYDAGHHCWGHENLNWAFKRARGKLINICDDDDVWMPDAAQSIRNAGLKYPGIPLLFRFKTFYGSVLWDQAGLIDRGHIGGHCLVQPNIPGKIGRMDCAYAGDFELIDSCIKLHGGAAAWVDKIIAVARPIDG